MHLRRLTSFQTSSSRLNCLRELSLDRRSTDRRVTNGEPMAVLAYVLLTVAVFAVLGYVQKLVEKL